MAQQTSETFGIVRGGADIYNLPSGSEIKTNYNNRGDLIVAQALPQRAELVRQGKSWGCQLKAANAFTLLITIPSTLATLALQNCEPSNGKSYVIDRVWVKAVTTTAAANYIVLLAQNLPPTGIVPIAHSANVTIYSLSGRASYTGKAQICAATTTPVFVADYWDHIAGVEWGVSTSIGAFCSADVFGRFIVPPGGAFGVSAQEAVSGGTAIQGIEWHEVQLDLGG